MRNSLITILILIIVSPVFSQPAEAKLANEYFQQGEYDKALSLYETLENNRSAIPIIHANYFQLLLEQTKTKEADKYLKKILRDFPNNIQYQVDQIFFYQSTQQAEKAKQLLDQLKKDSAKNQYQLSAVAQKLVSRKMYNPGISFYNSARQISGRQSTFALDLAAVYRSMDQKELMTEEYINYAEGNPANINYVKNLFQNMFTDPEDQDLLEGVLIDKIQKNPDNPLYTDLLIWLELQRKNFYSAFIQARALDKRNDKPGDESMRIAKIAYDNKSWQDAIDIYHYVLDKYPDSYNYATARRFLISSKENYTKTIYPIDTTAIRSLVEEYDALFEDIGPNPTTLGALKNEALLRAFYLDELDTAISILHFVISHPRAGGTLIAETKLDLGDIYILTKEPWEATLLYSQVEKAHKESQLAFEAKLRNAKLNYFIGNFVLAKSHLDILKMATTRTISNDAIALSLLISDNTAFDSTDQVMQEFATAELLIFTNQKEDAKTKLKKILEENPGHSITDEIYWLESRLALEAGNPELAIEKLDLIILNYDTDILSDDAFFKKAVILQDYINEDLKAKELYQEFLKRYPGSRHAAEARARFREIRGDLQN